MNSISLSCSNLSFNGSNNLTMWSSENSYGKLYAEHVSTTKYLITISIHSIESITFWVRDSKLGSFISRVDFYCFNVMFSYKNSILLGHKFFSLFFSQESDFLLLFSFELSDWNLYNSRKKKRKKKRTKSCESHCTNDDLLSFIR